MTSRPTGWNRLVARLRGEIPAAALEAYWLRVSTHVRAPTLLSEVAAVDPGARRKHQGPFRRRGAADHQGPASTSRSSRGPRLAKEMAQTGRWFRE